MRSFSVSKSSAGFPAELFLYELLLVDDELELQAQPLGCLSAQDHALHENSKEFHDGAEFGVDGQLQLDQGLVLVDFQRGFLDRVIHPVVDVEGGRVCIADTAAANIGLVGQDQGCRHRIDGNAGTLVVVADGGDDGGHLSGIAAHVIQDAPGHDSTGLGMVLPVHQIADVVEIPGDFRQLHRPLVIAQGLQNISVSFRHMHHMAKLCSV